MLTLPLTLVDADAMWISFPTKNSSSNWFMVEFKKYLALCVHWTWKMEACNWWKKCVKNGTMQSIVNAINCQSNKEFAN